MLMSILRTLWRYLLSLFVKKTRKPHLPLKKSENQIRVLIIEPAVDCNAKLVCSLEHLSLDGTHQPYEALSYTWGDEDATIEILLNDRPWMIRPNLSHALQQFRKQDEQLTIFVDAVCIDQKNVEERNWQVSLMSRIYSQASIVRCWLGIAAEGSDKAVAILRLAGGGGLLSTSTLENQPIQLANLRVFAELLSRPYWQRAWIIQEAVLASQATFHCGPYTIMQSEMPSTLQIQNFIGPIPELWQRLQNELKDVSPDGKVSASDEKELIEFVQHLNSRIGNDYAALANVRHNFQSGPPLTPSYFKRVAAQRTKEPRDHIYAFLGLLDEEISKSITPNYGESVARTYQQMAFQWLVKRGTGGLLAHAIGIRENVFSLPSWVPDFSGLTLPNRDEVSIFYDCNQDIPAEAELNDDGRLGIQAHEFDEVVDASPLTVKDLPFSNLHRQLENAKALHRTWRAFFGLDPDKIQNELKYPGGGLLEDAYWRTLTAQWNNAGFILEKHLTALKTWLEKGLGGLSPEQQQFINAYHITVTISRRRHLFKTRMGYFGRADCDGPVMGGDKLFLLASTAQPFVCRNKGDVNTYTLLDGTYTHGIMKVDRSLLRSEEELAEYGSGNDLHPHAEVAKGKWDKIWLA